MVSLGCPWPARRWFRLLWCLVAVAILAVLPFLIIELKNEHIPVHRQASRSKYCNHCFIYPWHIWATGFSCNAASPWQVTTYDKAMPIALCSRWRPNPTSEQISSTGMAYSGSVRASGSACDNLWSSHASGVFLPASLADLCHSNPVDGANICRRCLACPQVQGAAWIYSIWGVIQVTWFQNYATFWVWRS